MGDLNVGDKVKITSAVGPSRPGTIGIITNVDDGPSVYRYSVDGSGTRYTINELLLVERGGQRAAETKTVPSTEVVLADPDTAGVNPKDVVGETKPPLHLVPAALGLYTSQAMKNGADKYGPFNWREQPIQAHAYVAAIRRHLDAWYDGEDDAEDSGINHLAHAAAGLGILLDALALGNLIDDRPPAGPAAKLIAEYGEDTE